MARRRSSASASQQPTRCSSSAAGSARSRRYGWTIPAAGTRWAHVDIAPGRPSADLAAPDIAVEADARPFLRAAVTRLESRGVLDARVDRRPRGTECRRSRGVGGRDGHRRAPLGGPGRPSRPGLTALRRLLPDDAIVATDAGNFGGWAARGFRFRRPGTFLGPTSGAMGYGLPAAIAAGARPSRPRRRRARRRRRPRDDPGGARDGGPRWACGRSSSSSTTSATALIRTYQDRREARLGASPRTSGPVDFAAAVARARGAGRSGRDRRRRSSRRSARRSSPIGRRSSSWRSTAAGTGVDATP